MGVSGIHSEHKKIRLAYRESAMAMMYNENVRQDYHEIEQQVIENGVDTSNSLRFYVDKMFWDGQTHPDGYDPHYENDLYQALKEADKQKAYKCTDRFAEFLLTKKTTDEALYYILRYVDKVVMSAVESDIRLEEIFPFQQLRKAFSGILLPTSMIIRTLRPSPRLPVRTLPTTARCTVSLVREHLHVTVSATVLIGSTT